MEEELKTIMSDFERSNLIPTAHLRYLGDKKTYIVWTIIDENPILCSDDENQYSEVMVDIDIFSESNYLNIMSQIKNKMKENEWMWTEDSQEMYENETRLYHRTCSFMKERYING